MTNLSPTTSPFGGLENPYLALKLTSSNTKASLTSDTVEWITYYLFAHSTSDGFWVTKVRSRLGLGRVWAGFGLGLSRVWVRFRYNKFSVSSSEGIGGEAPLGLF